MNSTKKYVINDIKDQASSLKLIELVKEHGVLWSVTSKKYLDSNLKEDAWRNISQDLGQPVEVCRKKWSSLCAYYRKEKAKIKQSMITGSGCSDVYNSSWFAYESMGFVGITVNPRKTQSTKKISQTQPTVQNDELLLLASNEQHDQPPYTQPTVENVELDLSTSIVELDQTSSTLTAQTDELRLDNVTSIVEPSQHPATSSAALPSETGEHSRRKKRKNYDEKFEQIFTSIGHSLETIIDSLNGENSRNVAFGNLITETLNQLPVAQQEELIKLCNEAMNKVITGQHEG